MTDLLTAALERFETAYRQAVQSDPAAAPLMALATAGNDARPSVRTVRFTGVVDGCFTFFANRESGKGRQMQANPWAGLCFWWPRAEHQITIDGSIGVLPDGNADELWRTRPRPAAVMAWVSSQSEAAADRDALEARYRDAMNRFNDQRIPRPPHWIAYGVRPARIEFWHGSWERRHHRDAYLNTPDGWQLRQLDP